MARFLCGIAVFLLAVSTSLLLVNAEEEKLLSDQDLETKNDEPVLEDQELLDDLSAEVQNGKRLNVQYKYLVLVWFSSCLSFLLKSLFFYQFDFIKETEKVLYQINKLIRSFLVSTAIDLVQTGN